MISIVVPIYKVEKYIRQSIDSILAQTYKDLEIILVDDGTPDNCGAICDDYAQKDSRIKVIHKTNGGLSDARNAGLRIATGDFIGFVDSDDWIEPDMFRILYDACQSSNADIAVCGFYREFSNTSISEVKLSEETVYSGSEALSKLIEGKEIQDHVWTKLYRANLWNGVSFPCGKVYEDIRTTFKTFLKADKVCTVKKPLYHYRQCSGSISEAGINEKKLQWLEAVYEQKSFFYNKDEYKGFDSLFKIKILYTEGCILREWLLIRNKDIAKNYYDKAASLYIDIKFGRKEITRNDFFPKSIRIISSLSFLSLKTLKKVFGSRLIRKHVTTSYIPFD